MKNAHSHAARERRRVILLGVRQKTVSSLDFLQEAHRVASTDAPRTDGQDTSDVRRKAGKDYVAGTNGTAADPIVSSEENKLLPQVKNQFLFSILRVVFLYNNIVTVTTPQIVK